MYLSLFDENGRRISSVVQGVNYTTDEEKQQYLDKGYIEHSDEDWNYYVGNNGDGENGTGYIRDAQTGKPISAPPYTPSKEELISDLDAEYKAEKANLCESFTSATMQGDTETADSIATDLADLDAWYDAEYEKIVGEA